MGFKKPATAVAVKKTNQKYINESTGISKRLEKTQAEKYKENLDADICRQLDDMKKEIIQKFNVGELCPKLIAQYLNKLIVTHKINIPSYLLLGDYRICDLFSNNYQIRYYYVFLPVSSVSGMKVDPNLSKRREYSAILKPDNKVSYQYSEVQEFSKNPDYKFVRMVSGMNGVRSDDVQITIPKDAIDDVVVSEKVSAFECNKVSDETSMTYLFSHAIQPNDQVVSNSVFVTSNVPEFKIDDSFSQGDYSQFKLSPSKIEIANLKSLKIACDRIRQKYEMYCEHSKNL